MIYAALVGVMVTNRWTVHIHTARHMGVKYSLRPKVIAIGYEEKRYILMQMQ